MVTTIIGIAGVALGVAALIVTLAIMNGFQSDIKKKIIDAQAHVSVYGHVRAGELPAFRARLERSPHLAAYSLFVMGQGILTFNDRSTGVVVKGLDPESEFRTNNLKTALVEGSWEAVTAVPAPVAAILLGEELAKSLGAWVGGDVILVSPKAAFAVMGIMPRMKNIQGGRAYAHRLF